MRSNRRKVAGSGTPEFHKRRANISVDPDMRATLDAMAAEQGVSYSAVVRDLIEWGLMAWHNEGPVNIESILKTLSVEYPLLSFVRQSDGSYTFTAHNTHLPLKHRKSFKGTGTTPQQALLKALSERHRTK